MRLEDLVSGHNGIVHRHAAVDAGIAATELRAAVRSGAVRVVRRQWLVGARIDHDLLAAASTGGRISCVSLARRRGWFLPETVTGELHLRVDPHARSPVVVAGTVVHWTKTIAPSPPRSILDSTENALAHIAACLPRESALVAWESAVRSEGLSVDALRRVRWTSIAARECSEAVNGLSDSGLETLVVVRLAPWGIPIRQQIVLAGHRVDLLIGERLVVQIDGFAHHSTPAQRGRDVAHDRELMLRGYTVLRFAYAQVVHDWPAVERAVARAIASGAHRAT